MTDDDEPTAGGPRPGDPEAHYVELLEDEVAAEEIGTEIDSAPPRSQWQLFRRRFFRHKLAMLGLVLLVLLCVAIFAADLWVPQDPREQDILAGVEPPSSEHWFGTDANGRDYFARVIYAGQISLKIGLTVALISTIIGTITGSLAGFFGRWVEQLLMRITDLFLIVPGIAVLAVAVKFAQSDQNPVGRFVLGNGSEPRFGTDSIIIFVLAMLGWMPVARIVRGQVLSVKEKEFVEAARAVGASNFRIITRHLLPNCIGPIVVNATLAIAVAIVTESTLSFLGFGVQPPETSWGVMLERARANISFDEHLLYFPGLFILLTVLAVNFLGDGLRDAFDPQARR
ncbi:ABC transporter permease [Iamia sp. SCSIO 61187]|uniref:ABC transporter permease n=1 Tax=Iamia sp. SCSIO 61187 TaxID=2722752 RepID=UPI001C637B50|nr:ABC transporter permease [Iamia sp. SCSIO 61187]QYG93261.1 ABC transporter permease [Iamia sp. SCSIO 61187]